MRLCRLIAGILVLLATAKGAIAASTEIVRTTEHATALVRILRDGRAVANGSAFCIDANGRFITNAHVASGHDEIEIVIDPSLKTQRIYKATVLRSDGRIDLAEIRVKDGGPFTAIPLGKIDGLIETEEIIAFGYPYGEMMALDPSSFPSISVNTGHISSLRREHGDLQYIQVDAALNPGNSGGPVIDSDGKVIGIVEKGIPGSGISDAIPVSHIDKLLADPEGTLIPMPGENVPPSEPAVRRRPRREPAAVPNSPPPAPPAAEPQGPRFPLVPPANRLPVPSGDALVAAHKRVEEAFKKELANAHQADYADLAKQMADTADQTNDDDAGRYALWCEARRLAVKAADFDLADDMCGNLYMHFDLSLGEARQGMLEDATGTLIDDDANQSYILLALRAADDCLSCDDFKPLPGILKLARQALRQTQNHNLAMLIGYRDEWLTQQQKAWTQVKPMMDKLAANPDDAEANLAVGKYVCFVRGDWATGLPMLAKCSDVKIKQAAGDDLADPIDGAGQQHVADQWYILGNQPLLRGDRIRLRAYFWYQKALPQLDGESARSARERIEELQSLADKPWGQAELWLNVREAMRNRSYEETKIVGGGFAHDNFEDLPPAGDVLIGFRFGLGRWVSNVIVSSIQPIYLTPSGAHQMGRSYGDLMNEPTIVMARPGYAVGALEIHGGGNLDSVRVTFMKIGRSRLDPSNSYASEKVGGDASDRTDLDGGGVPIVGIRGEDGSRGGAMGLGVVFMSAVNEQDAPPDRSRQGR
jgi:S1-C subfamily serine protease